ncbi:12201_t:CDS:2 [Acaulospora colombiana]|uniref:12201_t:CDS:1 n=1 Tax=Acaulospora colombiana TaxID=27376 RepID=A0ACA9NNE1_9GLOM|nr:12201_t:CDS:2 [Acaulospora colombiana]
MTDSAVTRVPPEIWWIILDEVIDLPGYLNTTFNGNDWIGYLYTIQEVTTLLETKRGPFLWSGGTVTSAQVGYRAPTRAPAQVRTTSEKRTELTSKDDEALNLGQFPRSRISNGSSMIYSGKNPSLVPSRRTEHASYCLDSSIGIYRPRPEQIASVHMRGVIGSYSFPQRASKCPVDGPFLFLLASIPSHNHRIGFIWAGNMTYHLYLIPTTYFLQLMIYSRSSAVSRTPLEVWWMILDEAIDVPIFFSTVYSGDNWIRDSKVCVFKEEGKEYREKEKQRKTISLVSVFMGKKLSPHPDLKAARRVFISHAIGENVSAWVGERADWQVIRLEDADAKEMARVSLPCLRRLVLSLPTEKVLDLSSYLRDLGWSEQLTWLEFSPNVDGHSSLSGYTFVNGTLKTYPLGWTQTIYDNLSYWEAS